MLSKRELSSCCRILGIDHTGLLKPREKLIASAAGDIRQSVEVARERREVAFLLEDWGIDDGRVPARAIVQVLNEVRGHAYAVAAWAVYRLIEQGFLLLTARRLYGRIEYDDGSLIDHAWFTTTISREEPFTIGPYQIWDHDPDAKTFVLLVKPTADLRAWWLSSPGAAPVMPPAEPSTKPCGPQRRRAYSRDHFLFSLYLRPKEMGGHSDAKIRDAWNAMTDEQRARICPELPDRFDEGQQGRDTAKHARMKAAKEHDALQGASEPIPPLSSDS